VSDDREAVQEGSCDETPFEDIVLPFLHPALALYYEKRPKTVCIALSREKMAGSCRQRKFSL